jgi:CBS-domain-containing membrane protein
MTPDVTTPKRNDKLTLADDIMHLGRIRHLPVLDDDGQQVVGVVANATFFVEPSLTRLVMGGARSVKFLTRCQSKK